MDNMAISRELFLKAAVPEDVVDIPGLGPVRVRGLTRLEVIGLQSMPKDTGLIEKRIIRLGLVDPVLTDDDVDAWYDVAPAGHTDLIVDAVSRLSGLGEGATKSGVPPVRNRRRT